MFERFTRRSRATLASAQNEAGRLGHNFLGTEHLLLGLLAIGEGVASDVLTAAGTSHAAVDAAVRRMVGRVLDQDALAAVGIDLDSVRQAADEAFGPGALDQAMRGRPLSGAPPFTPRAKKVLELALREALSLGHSYIGTEHILLAIVREGRGVAAQILTDQLPGVDLRTRVIDHLAACA